MNLKFISIAALVALTLSSCDKDDDTNNECETTGTTGTTDPNESSCNPIAAFDEFNSSSVTISYDGDEMTIESTAIPNHTSPYWDSANDLYIDPVVADAGQMSPGTINSGNYSLTVPTCPAKASSTSATGLGAIGLSVTGVPIFNDEEGPNIQLTEGIASGFDYAGGHMGPTGYHYHLESADNPENTVLSYDDDALNGILQDGFLLYGRKCSCTGTYPTDLDESGGHTCSTQHSDGAEFYHYHIINEIYVANYYALFATDLQGTPNAFD